MFEPQHRFQRALLALEGLSIGDAFGERFLEVPTLAPQLLAAEARPVAPWAYTDDTQMALSIVQILAEYQTIEQEALAQSFAVRYDPSRGYGPAMHRLLRLVGSGVPWQEASFGQFGGQGSYGNGAAMRVAPVGAYFADDLDQVVAQAQRSAEVTHAHPEGIAGAIAIALAAAWAWRIGQGAAPQALGLLDLVIHATPESEVRSRLIRAADLSPATPAYLAASTLGNGSQLSAQDTVPYALWVASSYLTHFEMALWNTARGLGDIDTNCAIVGGIVGLRVGMDGIPPQWQQAREPLPSWAIDSAYSGTVTLYRAVDQLELAQIAEYAYRGFPRLPAGQPYFYPVLSEQYAADIAQSWVQNDPEILSFVTRFQIHAAFLERYPVQLARVTRYQEYAIPADDLAAFNAAIIGPIEVIAEFRQPG